MGDDTRSASQADAPDLIWHYTDSAGLIGILSDDEIWATQVGYLNDTSEIDYAFSLAMQALRRISTGLEESDVLERVFGDAVFSSDGVRVFVACFCTYGDLLSQWRGYANDDGFAVGFDPGALHKAMEVDHLEIDLVRVDYASASAEAAAAHWAEQAIDMWSNAFPVGVRGGALKHFVDGDLQIDALIKDVTLSMAGLFEQAASFSSLAAGFKDGAFREEREWRLVARTDLTVGARERLCFRASRHGVVPFVKLPTRVADGASPVREIKVGPGLHGAGQIRAVRLLLQRFGVPDDVQVTTSGIPYRS